MTLDDLTGPPADDITFSAEDEISAYRAMLLIRRFDEKAGQLYALGAIRGLCPLSIGQEAAIVGVQMAAQPGDQTITGYRNHGHMLALGLAPERIMGELLGRDSGLSHGKGGSIIMYAREQGFFGGHGSLGAAAPIGAGIAFANKRLGNGAVCICCFGDVAASSGRIYEAFRLAADFRLPIVFVIDNNTAAPGMGIALGAVPSALAERGAAFAIPGEQVDGIDVRKVRAAARRALERARSGDGPAILEILTYRYRGHAETLVPRAGREGMRRDETDPIAKSRGRILQARFATEAELKSLEAKVRERVNGAAGAGRAAPPPAAALHTAVLV